MSRPAKRPGLFVHQHITLLFVFWFSTNLHISVSFLGGPPVAASYAVFILFGGMALVVSAYGDSRAQAGKVPRGSLHLLIWMAAFSAWTMLAWLYSSHREEPTNVLLLWLSCASISTLLILLMSDERVHLPVIRTMALVAVFGTVMNLVDFLSPSFSEAVGSVVPGRSAGLYQNPNLSGMLILMAMTVGVTALPLRLRWALVVVSALGIALTLSRSAVVAFAATIALMCWTGMLGQRWTRSLLLPSIVAVLALAAFAITSGALVTVLLKTPLANHLTPAGLNRLGLLPMLIDTAASDRQNVLAFSISEYASSGSPLIGLGLGHTREWGFPVGPHNMYALFLVEGGLIGLLLYLSLLWIVWRNSGGVSWLIIFQFTILGLVSHNLLDNPTRVLFLILVCAGAVGAKSWSSPRPVSELSFQQRRGSAPRLARSLTR